MLVATIAFVFAYQLDPRRSHKLDLPNRSGPNKFGIGVYTDTSGSPSAEVQLQAAHQMTGDGGWVTLYLCSWRVHNGKSCMNSSTTVADDESIRALRLAYKHNLRVVARLGYPYTIRDHADDAASTHKNYTSLAAAYRRVISALPLPPGGELLYVQVGNEFNACNEWRCSGPTNTSMSRKQMAAEVAAFASAVADALKPMRQQPGSQLRIGHAPIANWDTAPCQCSSGNGLGPGQHGQSFLSLMQASIPDVFSAVDFLSSHPYPYSNSPFGTDKASRGLTFYRNETATIGRPELPVLITETGWRAHGGLSAVTEAQRTNWTVLAYQQIWGKDSQVIGVCPFLLAGQFWEPKGWPWLRQGNDSQLIPLPVYEAVKVLAHQ
jgi:hypothetical protein